VKQLKTGISRPLQNQVPVKKSAGKKEQNKSSGILAGTVLGVHKIEFLKTGICNLDDGEEDNDKDCNGDTDGNEVNDGDGNDGVPGNDVVTEDDISDSDDEGFISTSVNKPGPCAWKSVFQCICVEQEALSQCMGNSNKSCFCSVHHECLLFREHTQTVSRGATPMGRNHLVCPMHHPQYQLQQVTGSIQLLKERHHQSPSNCQPPNKETSTVAQLAAH
jgi:hypothetical protein